MSPTDSIPPMSHTPAHGTPSGPLLDLMERTNEMTIRVDRLVQSGKLLKWVAMTAAAFALGSALTVAKMLYGWGRDDEAQRSDVRQMSRDLADIRTELKEMRALVYARRSQPAPLEPPTP